MLLDQLKTLAAVKQGPCITIALQTHRTHPDNLQDPILLKNLLTEAEQRLLKEFDKRSVQSLLDNIHEVEKEIDHNHNMDGLYVFLSNNIRTFIRTIWPPAENKAYLDDSFALRGIIKAYNRAEKYYILQLSQSGAFLYEALDEKMQESLKENGFPFTSNPHYLTDQLKSSDGKQADNQVKEYFNRIDKAMVATYRQTALPVIVASTQHNYNLLLEVADQPGIYQGHFTTDHNRENEHTLAEKAWPVVMDIQKKTRAAAIDEMFSGVSAGKVLTDLQEIWRAAQEGRGELLLVKSGYSQPVGISGQNFEFAENRETPGVHDDLVSDIAWEVKEKNGRVFFTAQEALKELGDIALLTRY